MAGSTRFNAVAHGTEAGIGLLPGFHARDSDELQITAATEAQPLHDRQAYRPRRIPCLGENLVPGLADDALEFDAGNVSLALTKIANDG